MELINIQWNLSIVDTLKKDQSLNKGQMTNMQAWVIN